MKKYDRNMSADGFSDMTEKLGLHFLLRFYFIPDFREVIFQKLENNEKPYDIRRWYMQKFHGVDLPVKEDPSARSREADFRKMFHQTLENNGDLNEFFRWYCENKDRIRTPKKDSSKEE